MNLYELASRVIEAMEAERIPYMVVGALSSSVFGIPRATKDVDIVLQLPTREPLRRLEERLADVVAFDPQVTFETLTGSVRHILKAKTRPPFIVELFELGTDPFVVERFLRRRTEWSAQNQAPGFSAHGGRCNRAETALGQTEGFGGRQGCACGADTRQTGYGLSHALE